MPAETLQSTPGSSNPVSTTRLRSLQALGIFCGFAAGAWLGGAEAPIKLVSPDISPITVSLIMVCGVFLARWSVPAFLRGTSHVRSDVRQAPHLVVWAVLAGCMWAVANTLTIYAIRMSQRSSSSPFVSPIRDFRRPSPSLESLPTSRGASTSQRNQGPCGHLRSPTRKSLRRFRAPAVSRALPSPLPAST